MANPLNALYDAVGWVVKELYNGLSPIFGDSSGWTWALTIIILVVLVLFGGGWYGRGRWF